MNESPLLSDPEPLLRIIYMGRIWVKFVLFFLLFYKEKVEGNTHTHTHTEGEGLKRWELLWFSEGDQTPEMLELTQVPKLSLISCTLGSAHSVVTPPRR
jgi:hypothetical protein